MATGVTMRGRSALAAAIGLLIVAAGCGPERTVDQPETPPAPAGELPPELTDATTPPDAGILLPPLEGYTTDDHADPGELESSLDHGSVPYVEVRRRLILDEQGFTSGEVTVVTVEPESNGAERVLEHRFKDASRTPVRIAGVDMLRIETQPHAVLAWTGPTFVVTFARGQEMSDRWLEDLALATVEAIVSNASSR